MTLTEYTIIEAALLKVIDDGEYAASCARAALGNLRNPAKYALTDTLSAHASAKNAQVGAAQVIGLLRIVNLKEDN
jgi:hypothetical protein